MTVSTTNATKTYIGDGATVAFPTDFAFFAASDIAVIERDLDTGVETLKTMTTDYTVTGGEGTTGTVMALVPPPATVSWTIRRVLSETQETDLPVAGSLPSNAVEQMVDRAVMMIQQHSEELERALVLPVTDPDGLSTDLPSSVDRAGKFLGFDGSGNTVAAEGTSTVELGFEDGSESGPSVRFLNDQDTGVYRPGDNQVAVATNGAEALRIDTLQRILAGHTLSLPSGAAQPRVQIVGTTRSDASVSLNRFSDSIFDSNLNFVKSRGLTPGQNVIVQNGDAVGRIAWLVDDGTDLESFAAQILCVVDGVPSADNTPGMIALNTTSIGNNSPTPRVLVDSLGRVTIGSTQSTDANAKLDVDGVVKLKSYTVETLPPVVTGGQVYVSNEVGGGVQAYGDGTNWRRVSDGAIVS